MLRQVPFFVDSCESKESVQMATFSTHLLYVVKLTNQTDQHLSLA